VTVTVEPGGTFAGYAVETVVGRGGMGIVYRAADVALGRPVALKLIAPEFADDERFRARFLRESRLAASLDHPNVVPIYAAGEAAGQLYIAMRFVDGSDLKTLLSRGSLTPERWLAIVEQVASALDAAHHRGLVHRDVKPGNVLVDEGGHAYLTDFGVTKQVGAASTDTGRIMGTLDYLAPEQIRGDPVDGRADVYALGCVLYECVVGTPPFRRETEPETLWAHMQDEPTPLPEQPALEAVLHKALAKDREERHATCGELVGEAREALGLGTGPAIRGRRIPPGLLRRRRVILAAGLAVLAATVAAVAVALVGGGGTEAPPSDNGVAAIAATGDGIASFAETSTAPGNLAVGEGAVWALNTEDETVSRLDPKTGDVVDSFDTGHQPTDIAAGAGAVWVGNGDGKFRQTARLSRVDPDSTAVTRTVKLPAPPGGEGFSFSAGFPAIAVGAGGVWASTPDETVARIDPKTGRIAANVKIEAKSLAAGKEGVWLVNVDNAVTRIDPRTNRPGQRIEVGSNLLSGVAVGAGSVWATSEEGLLWRIEPGPKPITRTIDVGIGSAYVAFGAGYVWTANWVKGTVSRIDPRTNAVVSTVRVGAPQALAAGEGAAWVSVASGPRGTLPASTCSGIASGGRTPDLLIASDMPLQGSNNAPPRAVVGGIRAVLADRGFRAGRFTVGYQSCDDSTAQTDGFEHRKCAANANAYSRAERLVAVIGTWDSFCAQIEIPILNAAPGGPLALVSPANTHPNLTRGGVLALPPPIGRRGEPGAYYPTGERNYFRTVARGDLQGVALAELAAELRLRRVYLLYDDALGRVLFADGFARAAPRLGVEVAGNEGFLNDAPDYDRLVGRIARSGADGVVLGGWLGNAGELLKALRAGLDRRTAMMTGDGFAIVPDVVDTLGRAADGLYVVVPDVPPEALEPTAAGRSVVRALGATAYAGYVMQAAAATEAVMDAIARSDGTRASVLERLRTLRETDGIIGGFRFDRYGDMTPAKLTVLRVRPDKRPRETLRGGYRGAVLDRVLSVPTGLGD
jgi:ABC-type branched-subunit amino acid transport system substrate-binding protein